MSLLHTLLKLEQARLDAVALEKPLLRIVEYFDDDRIKADGLTDEFYTFQNGEYWSDADEFDEKGYQQALEPFKNYLYPVPAVIPEIAYDSRRFIARHLRTIDRFDYYGTGLYRPNRRLAAALAAEAVDLDQFYLFETYGDEDSERHHNLARYESLCLLYTPCLFYISAGEHVLEVADMVVDQAGHVSLRNHGRTIIDSERFVELLRQREICGKRAFYYYPEKSLISLRCSDRAYLELKQWQDPDRPIGNNQLSGCRLLLQLEQLLESP